MSFFDSLSNIKIFGGKSSVVGIDIGSSSIKMVEAIEKNGKVELVKYGTLALGPFGGTHVGSPVRLKDKQVLDAITESFKAIGIKTRNGGFAIPLKLSLIVTLEIPASASESLEKVVPIEARKYIPLPPSEVNLAWSEISSTEPKSMDTKTNDDNKKIKVLVAAIHNSTIKDYLELANQSGIESPMLEIETFSAIRSVAKSEDSSFALLDIGAIDSKVAIYDEGSITTSHSINKGSHEATSTLAKVMSVNINDAEKMKRKMGLISEGGRSISEHISSTFREILEETQRVLDNYKKESKKDIKKLYLIGGGSALKGIVNLSNSVLNIDCTTGDAFSKMALPTETLREIFKESGPEYCVAAGLALRMLEDK